jgi:hypothetical protein
VNAVASNSNAFIMRVTQLPIDSNQNDAKVAMLAIYVDLHLHSRSNMYHGPRLQQHNRLLCEAVEIAVATPEMSTGSTSRSRASALLSKLCFRRLTCIGR